MAGYEIATIGGLGDARPCCAACDVGGPMGELVQNEAIELASEGFLPTFVWPSDIEAYKRKVDPDMVATNATATTCSKLPAPTLAAWKDFFKSWQDFRAEEFGFPWVGGSNKYEEARDFEKRLSRWQEVIGAVCDLPSPKVRPPEGPDLSSLKWVAGAVALVAVAYIASPLIMGARKVVR